MSTIKKYKWIALGCILGAVAGFLYWKTIGCNSGSCLITSKPLNSTLYGTLMGGLLFSFIPTNKTKSR